jgi:lysine---8-amino-7-oxononanoate aminotransferase
MARAAGEPVALLPDYATLLEKNRRYLWNPFTQMKGYLDDGPIIVERGEGVKLVGVDGREYYDGNSSMWLNVHGHRVPELNEAIAAQLDRIAHSTLLGMGSLPAIELAERLVEITPPGLQKVFYSDSGATAVEIGLKLAFAYWRRVGRPEKHRFVSFRNAYHGDTIGCMAVGGIDLFHAEFGPLLLDVERVGYPDPYRFDGSPDACVRACLDELAGVLARGADGVACVVIEPLVQAAGGMVVSPPGFLAGVARLCREHDVLLLADEVATGFGRTGELFACEHEAVTPDILAVGKGLTGGYLPVAATLTTDALYDAFYGDFAELRTFFHGHSYTGNQLGCAVALASLDLLERDAIVERVRASALVVARCLEPCRALRHVGDVRQAGLMVGIELVADRTSKERFPWTEATGARVCRRALELGLITRPLGDVVTFLPAPAAQPEDLVAMLEILEEAIREVTEG